MMDKLVVLLQPERAKRSLYNMRVSKQIAPYLFLSPFLIIFAVFLIYPIVDSFYLSFTSAQGSVSEWVGLTNYRNLLTDEAFWKSLLNTAVILGVQVPMMLFLGLLLAVALNAKFIKGRPIFRLAIFLPVLIDTVTYSIVFSNIFNTDYGILNYLLGLVGIPPIDWLHTPLWAHRHHHRPHLALDRLQRHHPASRTAVHSGQYHRGSGDRRRGANGAILPHHHSDAQTDAPVLCHPVHHRHPAVVH